jgi:hypothetical protein
MYRVTFTDSKTGDVTSIKVHSIKSATVITESLDRHPGRYRNVQVSHIQPRRFRELVIVLEP